MKEAGGILWWPRWIRSLPGCCGEGPFSAVYSSEYDKRALVSPTVWQQFFSILRHTQGPVMIYWVAYLSQDRSSRFHEFEEVNYKNLAEKMGFVFKDTLWGTNVNGPVCLYPTAFMDSLGLHCVFKKKSIVRTKCSIPVISVPQSHQGLCWG